MSEELRNNGENTGRDPITGKFVEGNLGKPKGSRHLTTLVRDALKKLGKTKEGKEISYETALVEAILDKAIFEKDSQMIKLIWNYLDGMPTQDINLTDMDDIRKNYFDKLNELIKSSNQRNSKDNI